MSPAAPPPGQAPRGPMSKDALIAVVGGVMSALLYLSIHLGSPGALILAYFTPLPLFLVGLGLGLAVLVLAAAAAVVLASVAAGLPPPCSPSSTPCRPSWWCAWRYSPGNRRAGRPTGIRRGWWPAG